jgi:hypothetical protein
MPQYNPVWPLSSSCGPYPAMGAPLAPVKLPVAARAVAAPRTDEPLPSDVEPDPLVLPPATPDGGVGVRIEPPVGVPLPAPETAVGVSRWESGTGVAGTEVGAAPSYTVTAPSVMVKAMS